MIRPSPFCFWFSIICISWVRVVQLDKKKREKITRSQRPGGLKPQHHCLEPGDSKAWSPNQHKLNMAENLMVNVIIKSKKVEKWFKPFTVSLLFWLAVKCFYQQYCFYTVLQVRIIYLFPLSNCLVIFYFCYFAYVFCIY